ncbi:MAG: DUF2339 domain-containing protein [Terracidiphilus sp.]
MEPTSSGSVEEQLGKLRTRVLRLEEALDRHGIAVRSEAPRPATQDAILTSKLAEVAAAAAVPPVATAPIAAPSEVPRQQTPIPPPAQPIFSYAASAPADQGRSLESRIGSQWFNRIGILALLIGVAWFLKLAFDNHWIGPLGRVLIGLVAGAALIAWSERFRSRGYDAFSYSLKAAGSGILYLSLWAAFSYFHLIPAGAAFTAMIVVTAFNGYMAWVQEAELLALYAIAGGLSTPLLVSTGENHEVTLFSYLLMLDVAVLVLVALRPWSRLLFAAFTGTAIFVTGWWATYYTDAQSVRTAFFIACFFLLFAFAPRLVRMDLEGNAHLPGWDVLAVLLMPVGNAAFGFIAFYSILNPASSDWSGAWLAVAFAAFYLMLLRLPARGILRASSGPLSHLHLTVAVVFLTIAIPLKTHGRWLTIGWLAEGAALLWLASRIGSALLRVLSILCLALGLIALIFANPPASTVPFFNQRFATYCFGIAVFAFAAWVAWKASSEQEPQFSHMWHSLAATALLVVNALILIAICWEIHSFWWYRHWSYNWRLSSLHRMYAQFSYSAFFMAFGAVLLGLGFWRRSAFLRWQGLLLLAFSIGKVFLVDVSQLSQGYRIVSFLGLGALLLAVSFIYQRDWLNLRSHERLSDAERRPS